MLTLFVAVTKLKNFEALNTAVDVFNTDSVTSDLRIEPFLVLGKLAAFGLLVRRKRVRVVEFQALIAFISHRQNIFGEMGFAPPENLHVMDATLFFVNRDNFAALAVYDELVFYGVPFFFLEYEAFCLCFGRSVSHSVTSIIAIDTLLFSLSSSRFEGNENVPFFISVCSTQSIASLIRCLCTP